VAALRDDHDVDFAWSANAATNADQTMPWR
jgi:hypothetical protein